MTTTDQQPARDIAFDEEVAQRPDPQGSWSDLRPLAELEVRVRSWKERLDEACRAR